MISRIAVIAGLALGASFANSAHADDSPPTPTLFHVSVRGGFGGGGQSQNSNQNFSSWSGTNYQLAGTGAIFGVAFAYGPSNVRLLAKADNMVLTNGGYIDSSGNITQFTGGFQYNGSRVGTSFVAEVTGGISTAWGTLFDPGWDGCTSTGWFTSTGCTGVSYPATYSHSPTTAGIIDLATGARIDGGFEILADVWIGPGTNTGGARLIAGWNVDL